MTTQIVYAYEPTTGKTARTGVQYLTTASVLPDVALGLVASRFWGNFRATKVTAPDGRATAIAWIKYADSNPAVNGVRKLRRPLVFVEGIDFALRRNNSEDDDSYPVNRYIDKTGSIPLSEFDGSKLVRKGGYRNGLAGWNEMVDYNGEYKSLEKFPVLRQQLQVPTDPGNPANSAGGFDIIYLDFSDGASLIQHNAMVLAELLEWVNKPENRTANAEETLVIGTSMGGQVARFALAWMEQQNICHNSKLYVSFDSPHRGANVPLGIQHMFDRLQGIWFKDGPAEGVVKNQLKREATMQMVNFHFSNVAPGYRNDWQAWQQSPGSYPSLLRKVAVANGSGQAVAQPGMYSGMELLRMEYKFVSFSRNVAGPNHAYALPGTSTRGKNNVVFRYRKPYSLSGNWRYSYADPAWSYFDMAPGSTSRVAEEADKKAGPLKALHPTNTFMPTISTLDVKDAGSYNSPNFGYNVRQQIPESNLPNRAKYAFDAYFAAADENEPHVQITNGQASTVRDNPSFTTNNAAWIQNELRESAHLMPAVLTYQYNYGSIYRHLLPSVQVNAGGELYINHKTRPVFGGDERYAKPPVASGTFEAYTSNCATIVQINSGGLLGVGTPGSLSTSYPASLRMSANSLLDVRASGRVDVNVGSVLRIPAGATLVVRNGAALNVYGQLIVETGAYLCVENTANIVTSGAGTYTVEPGVNYFAKSGFNLGTLTCAQPATPLKATIAGTMTSSCNTGAPNYYPNYAQWTAAPSGGTGAYTYKWSIDYGTGRGYEGPYTGPATFGRCLNEGQYAVATVRVVVSSGTQQVTLTSNAQSQYGARVMFPNPADSFVEIGEAEGEEAAPADPKKEHKYKPMKIKAHNGQGKEVFTADDVTSATLRVDLRAWPSGLYQITIERDGKATKHQLSVQH